jgi:hypothetical protein
MEYLIGETGETEDKYSQQVEHGTTIYWIQVCLLKKVCDNCTVLRLTYGLQCHIVHWILNELKKSELFK